MKWSGKSLKEVGKLHWCLMVFNALSQVPEYWGNLGTLFIAPKLKPLCRTNFSSLLGMNSTEQERIISEWPECQKPESEYWLLSNYNGSARYDNWTKCSDVVLEEGAIFTWTATQKYSLACDRQWLITLSNSIYMFGFFVSAITCGSFADRFGRRAVVLSTMVLNLISVTLVAVAPNVEVYFVARFVLAIGDMGRSIAAHIIVMELLRSDQRILVQAVGGPIGVIGLCLLPGITTLLNNHEHFCYFLACIFLVFLIMGYFLYIESPRWLSSRKRLQEAEKMVEWIATINNQEKEGLQYLYRVGEEQRVHVSPLELFRTPLIRRRTVILWLLWFSVVLINYGLLYNLADFGTDVRVSIVIMALVDFPGCFIVVYVTEKIGRQLSLFITMLLAGICCLLMAPLVQDRSSLLLTTLALLGKTFSGYQFFLVYQHTPELYPTALRTIGIGSASTVARIGGMIAPLITLLNVYWPPMLVVLIGGITVLAAGLVPLLPDTTGHELPQTIDEGENFQAHHRYKLVLPPEFACFCKSENKSKETELKDTSSKVLNKTITMN